MLVDESENGLEFLVDKKRNVKSKKKIFDGFEGNKVVNQVLDKSTVMTLYGMIKSNVISYINGIVRAGKESVLFWAVDENKKDVALKVYLVTTSNFKRRSSYIAGDPRFSRIKKGTRSVVEMWAKKEFRNINQCIECGISVVRPIEVTKNVLATEFIGKNGAPEKTLSESEVDMTDYDSAISLIRQLYQKAKLVHGDFSEFNIFKTKKGLVLFDLGSAVDLQHPRADEFLKRDINNISKFFARRGLTVKNPDDVLIEVKK